jgi:hypothetical protein
VFNRFFQYVVFLLHCLLSRDMTDLLSMHLSVVLHKRNEVPVLALEDIKAHARTLHLSCLILIHASYFAFGKSLDGISMLGIYCLIFEYAFSVWG